MAKRAVNQAKSLVELAQQASIYVPMAGVPSRLPSWIRLEAESAWSSAALQLAALESASLPSRLRISSGSRGFGASGSMDKLTAELDLHGEQRIVELACQADMEDGPSKVVNGGHGDASDTRSRPAPNQQQPESREHSICDFFPFKKDDSVETHIFSEIQCSREAISQDTDTNGASDPGSRGGDTHGRVSR